MTKQVEHAISHVYVNRERQITVLPFCHRNRKPVDHQTLDEPMKPAKLDRHG